jgi:hypothetical protein
LVEEHAEVKRLVYDADSAAVKDPSYDAIMSKAVTAFLTHAEEEEREQFPDLKKRLSAEDSDVRLMRCFRRWIC